MADLYLHLAFARRLRFAEGLHPLAGEALGRRPSVVALGACLPGLPGNERAGMSFFRRLFSRGGDAARWQKILAPSPGAPKIDLVIALAKEGEAGQLSRVALAIGMLAHEVLEEHIGALTSSLQPAERAAAERAQARLWLQKALPREKDIEGELRPVLELADPEANKKVIVHVELALRRAFGNGPGEAALARWLKGFAAEVAPLVERAALPPPLALTDHDARAAFDNNNVVEKVDAAKAAFVIAADRLAAAFATTTEPDATAISGALGNGKLLNGTATDLESMRATWKAWLGQRRESTHTRGRNPRPAFIEGETMPEQRLGSITKVMSLADLPPEAPEGAAPPPPPEASGPVVANPHAVAVKPPPPPAHTQEVSLAQIEAEQRAHEAAQAGFSAPPNTQAVDTAQIEAESFQAPALTQEVSAAQIESTVAQTAQQAAEPAAESAAASTEVASQPPSDQLGETARNLPAPSTNVLSPPEGAPTEAHNANHGASSGNSHENGVDHDKHDEHKHDAHDAKHDAASDAAPDADADAKHPPEAAATQPTDPPRE